MLRHAARVDDAVDANVMLGHAFQYDPRVHRGAFDGGKELILRSVQQVPTECDTAKLGIDQHRAVSVVPAKPQQAGLSGAIIFQALGQFLHVGRSTARNGIEDVAGGGKPCFNTGKGRMHAARNNAADSRDQRGLARHGDDAGGSADDVDHVAFANTRADSVPVRVERADWDGNARLQA